MVSLCLRLLVTRSAPGWLPATGTMPAMSFCPDTLAASSVGPAAAFRNRAVRRGSGFPAGSPPKAPAWLWIAWPAVARPDGPPRRPRTAPPRSGLSLSNVRTPCSELTALSSTTRELQEVSTPNFSLRLSVPWIFPDGSPRRRGRPSTRLLRRLLLLCLRRRRLSRTCKTRRARHHHPRARVPCT